MNKVALIVTINGIEHKIELDQTVNTAGDLYSSSNALVGMLVYKLSLV